MDATIESLQATIAAADAEAVALNREHIGLGQRIAALQKEIAEMDARRSEIYSVWSRSGLLPQAERRAAQARAALMTMQLPLLTATAFHRVAPESIRVTQIGPRQMRTTRGLFHRNADGSWSGTYGETIAPFDEATIRAQVKAAKGGAS